MRKNRLFVSRWLQLNMNKGDGEANSRWKVLITLLPHFLTMLTIAAGIVQYRTTVEREIRKEFFYKQVQCYQSIIDSVASLTSYNGTSKRLLNRKFENFRRIRNGSYLLYTTDSVDFYVMTFDYYFDRYIREDSITNDHLERISYKLFNSCRSSLNETIGVNLEALNFRKSLK